LKAVDGFLGGLGRRCLERGVFISLVDPQATVERFIDEHTTGRREWRQRVR
jgi:hypothetical protein